jgi:glycosyltransferase involved in cell wall biosynthesis
VDTKYTPDDLSVIVLTYNRPDAVLKIVGALPVGLEVIVADDGTLPNLSRSLPEHVKLYSHEHDGNRASTCRNAGAELATRPKLLFLDDDVTPHGLCFAAHSMALEMYDVSCGLLPQEAWRPTTDDRTLFYIREDQSLWNWAWSGNLAIRATIFAEVGGFDAETFNGGHGYEDVDLGRRLWLARKRFCLNRLALAHHPAPHTSESPSPAVLRNQARYEAKWDESYA